MTLVDIKLIKKSDWHHTMLSLFSDRKSLYVRIHRVYEFQEISKHIFTLRIDSTHLGFFFGNVNIVRTISRCINSPLNFFLD
jgi:hypothetical protein